MVAQTAVELTRALSGFWHGSYGTAICPAHHDRHPSLSITERDGKLLVKCHAGCEQAAGGAVRLAAATGKLVLAEGLETALSVLQATGKPVWACLGTSGLKAVILPPEVRMVFIAADGDQRGEDAAIKAADRFVAEGRRTKIARPPWGMDFNDLLGSESLAALATLAGGGRDI